MTTSEIEWDKPAILYVITINCYVKFGITTDWNRRSKEYQSQLDGLTYVLIKKISFDHRWQAELIEQVMKWRLRRWVAHGRHEWIELPVQHVMDCLYQTMNELSKEYVRHKYIHRHGKERWDFYKQIADFYFKN